MGNGSFGSPPSSTSDPELAMKVVLKIGGRISWYSFRIYDSVQLRTEGNLYPFLWNLLCHVLCLRRVKEEVI